MGNMSYCRFRNTSSDLRDCFESDGMWDKDELSEDEQKARRYLIRLCKEIAAEFEDVDE